MTTPDSPPSSGLLSDLALLHGLPEATVRSVFDAAKKNYFITDAVLSLASAFHVDPHCVLSTLRVLASPTVDPPTTTTPPPAVVADAPSLLSEAEQLLADSPAGAWTWEEEPSGDWSLYADRGAPIDPTRPAGLGNMQHGRKLLVVGPNGFDAQGEALRAFVVDARPMMARLIAALRDAQRRVDLLVADEPTGVYQEGFRAGVASTTR